MKIGVFKKKKVTWVKALDNKILFKHCAENKNEVTMSKYVATVEDLLFLHGVTFTERVSL